MTELEKVMRGLECCALGSLGECDVCPYTKETRCSDHLCGDALTLLKKHEARVMGFSEIASFDGVVYLEDIDKIDVIRAICNGYIVTFDLLSFSSVRGAPVGSVEDYNKRWRAWTARPTDEQRKAVKWDE